MEPDAANPGVEFDPAKMLAAPPAPRAALPIVIDEGARTLLMERLNRIPFKGTPGDLHEIHLRIEMEVVHALDAYGDDFLPCSNIKLNVKLACMLWGVLYENRKYVEAVKPRSGHGYGHVKTSAKQLAEWLDRTPGCTFPKVRHELAVGELANESPYRSL
jgi:hypothetical protein